MCQSAFRTRFPVTARAGRDNSHTVNFAVFPLRIHVSEINFAKQPMVNRWKGEFSTTLNTVDLHFWIDTANHRLRGLNPTCSTNKSFVSSVPSSLEVRLIDDPLGYQLESSARLQIFWELNNFCLAYLEFSSKHCFENKLCKTNFDWAKVVGNSWTWLLVTD